MRKKTPYDVIKSRHVTEKSRVLEQLQFNSSNPSVRKCDTPKYVFVVDKKANKAEIAHAIEEIYADRKITVVGVNTINVRPKRRTVRGRTGWTAGFKKAVVTLQAGDSLDEKV